MRFDVCPRMTACLVGGFLFCGGLTALPVAALAQDTADDGFHHLSLSGPEGFGKLTFDGANSKVRKSGPGLDGLVTVDPKRQTEAEVDPDIETDANGNISGIVRLVVFDDQGTTVTTAELPATGRTRLMTNTRQLGNGGESTRVKQQIQLRASEGSTTVALSAASKFGFGSAQKFGSNLGGNMTVVAGTDHRGKSRVEIVPFEPSFAEIVISDDRLSTATLTSITGDAVVLSDTLGQINGGSTRIQLKYAGARTGNYQIHATNGRFRLREIGLLGTTLAEAQDAAGDPAVILEDSVPRTQLFTTPAAHNIIQSQARSINSNNSGSENRPGPKPGKGPK